MTLWQCFDDVGGCDAWLSNWWSEGSEGHSYQWWTGWHSPKAIAQWSWPGKKRSSWKLIGHERWDDLNGFSWKSEARYAFPNASTAPKGHDLTPLGHWAVTYDQEGQETDRQWSDDILTEGALYLKGGGSKGPKGQNKGKGKGYTKGEGKGSHNKGEGKGEGDFPKGKGRDEEADGKGKNKGKGSHTKGKGMGRRYFPKGKGKGKNKGKSQSKDGLQD